MSLGIVNRAFANGFIEMGRFEMQVRSQNKNKAAPAMAWGLGLIFAAGFAHAGLRLWTDGSWPPELHWLCAGCWGAGWIVAFEALLALRAGRAIKAWFFALVAALAFALAGMAINAAFEVDDVPAMERLTGHPSGF